jgi:hypothetical protein
MRRFASHWRTMTSILPSDSMQRWLENSAIGCRCLHPSNSFQAVIHSNRHEKRSLNSAKRLSAWLIATQNISFCGVPRIVRKTAETAAVTSLDPGCKQILWSAIPLWERLARIVARGFGDFATATDAFDLPELNLYRSTLRAFKITKSVAPVSARIANQRLV